MENPSTLADLGEYEEVWLNGKDGALPWTNNLSISSGQTSLEPSFKSFLCLRWGVRLFTGGSGS